ncbi:APC family permease [Kineococcus rhizosphaerae]|uniref:Amino acid/polyamine/organocation transporter (APC superfamily) n=1 Tax=Kineococcus rhizosphaerae TaxID=559628 RepID=A0A2T0R1E7_9ACTN|nr:APC family permease [Kineococcus rhizosphaerae]PRY13372.1 amino acid/polyamine/organocation transporter (APC superfamily) [Kineococcus rhizosphaerae]
MANTTVTAPPSTNRRLSGRLGVGSIVFMVVAAAAPLTVVGGSVPIGISIGNGAGYPAMYAVGSVVLFFFAVGFVAMTRYVPNAGAFYTYIGAGLGRLHGLGGSFLALLTYQTIQAAVYGYLGAALGGVVADDLGGPDLPWWVWAGAAIVVVGLLGYRHIDLSSKVLGVLLIAEIGIVLVVDAGVVLSGGGPEGFSTASVTPSGIAAGAPGIGLMFALAGFIGFECTAVFRDESRDPDRTIPRATYASLAIIGVFYTVSAWSVVSAWGDGGSVTEAAADPEGMVVQTARDYVGAVAGDLVQVLLLTSLFACVLSFHNVVNRYVFSMANTGVLPRTLGRSHGRHHSPHVASLLQTGASVVLIAVFAACGLDPVLQVYTWMSGVATLGFILLMLLTCVAVLVFFARNHVDTRLWNTKVAPVVGVLGLAFAAYLTATNFGLLVGGWTVGAVFLVLTVASYLVGPLVGVLNPAADPLAVARFEAELDHPVEVPQQVRPTPVPEDHA